MESYIIHRTEAVPIAFTGELLAEFASQSATLPPDEQEAKQWFLLDIYRTAAGQHVGHIQYRAGSRLGTEQPVDATVDAPTLAALLAKLDAVDPDDYATGWPDRPEMASQDRRVMRFCRLAWEDVLAQCAEWVCGPPVPEKLL